MNGATTIQERLKDLRLNKGLKLEELAEQTGISKSALGSYEKDDYKEINHGNLILLADFYGVSLDYLFCRTENMVEINTPLRELHLSDEMIALLKSGSINNRLLSELALHRDFQRFLVDIEIFVDRIADMRIHDMNALLEANRQQIMEKYNPDENDLYLRTLALAQVKEENYFAHVIHQDLDGILHDIREAHRADTTTADTASPAMDIHQQLETAMHYEGTEEERKARIFLASLGIDYDKLTQEEFVTQINILKKSAHLKSANNLRGKSVPYMVHGKGNRKKRK